jgi:hypothetical protein
MGRKLHPKTWKLGFTSPRVNKHLASEKGFWQKRNVFLRKKNVVPFFLNPGSCGFQGIPGIPAGMHNLAVEGWLWDDVPIVSLGWLC